MLQLSDRMSAVCCNTFELHDKAVEPGPLDEKLLVGGQGHVPPAKRARPAAKRLALGAMAVVLVAHLVLARAALQGGELPVVERTLRHEVCAVRARPGRLSGLIVFHSAVKRPYRSPQ